MTSELEKQLNIIQSTKYFDCIFHHAAKEISEENLRKEVLACGNGGVPILPVPFNTFLEKLTSVGILDRILVPDDDEYHYRLSPAGESTLEYITKNKIEAFDHPLVR